MFTDITVKGAELKSILSDIAPLIPSGTKSVPVGVSLSNGVLSFTCMGLCNYEATIQVDSIDGADITIAYTAVHDLIPSNEEVSIRIQADGMSVETSKLNRFFRVAYSVVSKLDYKEIPLSPIEGISALSNLRMLVKTQLPNLYKKEPAVDIYDEIAIMKYGNLWLQTRALGLPCKCTFTQECIKVLTSFAPKRYCEISSDTMLFVRGNCRLYVPMKRCTSLVNATTVIPKTDIAVRLNMDKFNDNIKLLKAMGCKNATMTLLQNGLTVYGESAEGSIQLPLGDVNSEFVASFQVPTDLAIICFNMFSGSLLEFLYKDGILCMRNKDLVMVLHVLV